MTLTAIYLEIPGKPIPLQRHRDAHKGWYPDPVTKKATFRSWKYNPQSKVMHQIKKLMRDQYPYPLLEDPVFVSYVFHMPIPIRWPMKARKQAINNKIVHNVRPDTSNLIKFYEDCMNETIFLDDCQISKTSALKLYSEKPRTQIWIRSMTNEEINNILGENYPYVPCNS